ncbi:hypothetical protein KSB_39590 [Ktedonobacter robiniae]|uniref:Uncharacterized protein n=1 Tax=Ktedonobacter robiniae TaxID=2778365 RepID=A0ABQ3URR0_9CHLR|nr:hypothetical protein KSB_39590 [Ktedonobacter robiniae]
MSLSLLGVTEVNPDHVKLEATYDIPKGVKCWCSVCHSNMADKDLYYSWEPRYCLVMDGVRVSACYMCLKTEKPREHAIYHIREKANRIGWRQV